MTLEEMKRQINTLNERMDRLEERNTELIDRIRTRRILSAQQSLVKKYRMFSIIGPVMATVILVLYREWLPLTLRIAIAAYFITAGLMDMYLCRGIGSIDYNSLGVAEVASRALLYRKRHHQFMAILITMCVPLLYLLIMEFSENVYAFWGCIAGAITGLAAGVIIYRKIMSDYRELTLDDE